MADTQIPAGWYADPTGDTTKLRYWDGMNWTEQTTDAVAPGGQNPQAAATPQATVTPQMPTVPTNPYAQSTPPPMNPYQQGAPIASSFEPDQSGKATAALICGILAIPGGIIIALFGYVLGIIAIVMGVKGRSSSKGGFATAGIILGIIALVISLINSILGVIGTLALGLLNF